MTSRFQWGKVTNRVKIQKDKWLREKPKSLYFLPLFFCFIHKCDFALVWNNTTPNTWVSEATICTLSRHLPLCSLSSTPSPAHCSVSSRTPRPLDTSSVTLEQLHLQHKGFPSLPSGFQIKTRSHHYVEILTFKRLPWAIAIGAK